MIDRALFDDSGIIDFDGHRVMLPVNKVLNAARLTKLSYENAIFVGMSYLNSSNGKGGGGGSWFSRLFSKNDRYDHQMILSRIEEYKNRIEMSIDIIDNANDLINSEDYHPNVKISITFEEMDLILKYYGI